MAKIKITTITEATQYHVNLLSGSLRNSDELECQAALGISADEAMQESFESSLKCWVALHENKPFAIFGVAASSSLNIKGAPWMLGTDDCRKMGKDILLLSKQYISKMLEPFDMLENWVDARNVRSVRWLKWCGFNIEEAEPYGIMKLPFHRFWTKKGVYNV